MKKLNLILSSIYKFYISSRYMVENKTLNFFYVILKYLCTCKKNINDKYLCSLDKYNIFFFFFFFIENTMLISYSHIHRDYLKILKCTFKNITKCFQI